MKTIKVDSNGDRVTKNGFFVYVYDIYAVMQTCEQVMKQQLGELQYSKTKGIEYFNNVFNGNPNLQLFESQSRSQLLNIDGVVSIQSFTYSQTVDELSYSATIKTIYGSDTINGNV